MSRLVMERQMLHKAVLLLPLAVFAVSPLASKAQDQSFGIVSVQPQDCKLRALADNERIKLMVSCPGHQDFVIADIDEKLVNEHFTAIEIDAAPPQKENAQ
jgi:hypothetical protein